jgi:hypothetical protein
MLSPNWAVPALSRSIDRMKRLDQMEWKAGTAFESFGVRIGIRVTDATVMNRLSCYLPPLWKGSVSPTVDFMYSLRIGRFKRFHILYRDSTELIRTMDLDKALLRLEQALEFNIAMASKDLFIHAGVVEWQGRAILLPGRSMSGKTTMVASFLRAGATYYSDEFAVLNSTGLVHPYPRKLRIRNTARREEYSLEESGTPVGSQPLRVGLVAMLQYKCGARWRPRLLSPGEAVLALLDNTLLARYRPRMSLSALSAVASSAVALKSNRDEAEKAVPLILNYLPML